MNHVNTNSNINYGPPKRMEITGPGVRDVSLEGEKPAKGNPGADLEKEYTGFDNLDGDFLDIEKYIQNNNDQTGKPKATDKESVNITVLHTNDIHGHLESSPEIDPKGDSTERENYGGAGQLTTIINRERKETQEAGDHFLLVDAGDMAMGTPVSGMFKGEPVIEVMNQQKYDAATIGNHEFDWGLEPLKNMIQQAKFPFVNANLTDGDGNPLPRVKPFIIKDLGDVKVGIVGVITPETAQINANDETRSLKFEDPAKTLQKTIPEMKKKGADIIMVLSHLGYSDDHKLAQQVEGIDLIVGGHSHHTLDRPVRVGNTAIVQTGSEGKMVGKVQLRWNPRTRCVVHTQGELIPVKSDSINPDSQVQSIVAKYQKKVDALMNRKLGKVKTDLIQPETGKETNLGNMVTDLMRQRTGAQVALINSGSLRSDLPRGVISYKDVYKVVPFDSSIVKVNMKGKDIMDTLETSAGRERDKKLQVSGLNVTYDSTRPEGKRLIEVSTEDGKPLDPEETYSVATIDYLLNGGDHYDQFSRGETVEARAGMLQKEMAQEFTQQSLSFNQALGRMRDLSC